MKKIPDLKRLSNLEAMRLSYISKADFIKLLENLEFISIKECEIEIIKGFKTIINDKNEGTGIQPLYSIIRIE